VEEQIAGPELRLLKSRGQLLRPVIFIGKEGLSAGLIKSLDEALALHELVKVKFADFKEKKKELTPQLAEKVSAKVVMRVGNTAVLFRRKPPQNPQTTE
jgi:RNA-binding protein